MILYKRFTLEERLVIKKYLDSRLSLGKIAKEVGKSRSSVSREVKRHTVLSEVTSDNDDSSSSACTDEYIVCNGCPKLHDCSLKKRIYDARAADLEYRKTLTESRNGLDLSRKELSNIEKYIGYVEENDESYYSLSRRHADSLPCSESTLYRIVTKNRGSSLKLKLRKGQKRIRLIDQSCLNGRMYSDFITFTEKNHISNKYSEMVLIKLSEKSLLIFMLNAFENMLLVYSCEPNSRSVVEIMNQLYSDLPEKVFKELFGLIITDLNTVFSNPKALEFYHEQRRTYIFYCREELKSALDKKLDWIYEIPLEYMSQNDLDDITSIINSASSSRLFLKQYSEDVLNLLGQRYIADK